MPRELPKVDPTRTMPISKLYQAELFRRWNRLDGIIQMAIITNDALGLLERPRTLTHTPNRFDFPSDIVGKQAAFDVWLRGAIDDEILQPVGWADSYVRAAYSKGVTHADRAMKARGVSTLPEATAATFNAPIHRVKLATLFARNFNELRGVSEAAGQNMSRIVSQGLATGIGPREIGRNLSNAISTIGKNRGVLIARTEIVRSHAEATLTRFEESGIASVAGSAEFITAGDDRVCQECEAYNGVVLSIADARGLIPLHPACRCTWLPVVE